MRPTKLLIALLIFSLPACAHALKEVASCETDPEIGMLYCAKPDSDVTKEIEFRKTQGYTCFSPEDYTSLMNYCHAVRRGKEVPK